MRYSIPLAVACLLISGLLPLSHAAPLHHDIIVTIDPERGHLAATDTVTLPSSITESGEAVLSFLLHPDLSVVSRNPGTELRRSGPAHEGRSGPIVPIRYEVTIPAGSDSLELAVEGRIHHAIRHQQQDRMRGVSGTPGIISGDGVYLGGASLWYPQFDNRAFSFSVDIRLPAGWDAVSQGSRIRHDRGDETTRVRWEESSPQPEIFVVAGRWQEYTRQLDRIAAMTFLRSDDHDLAERYLDATEHYLEMFSELIGPYPYDKFALVENFWETGYGMPSFTLLGSSVIRLPFILHSSYPHELMHNWWGNGVYVDYGRGNWAEGLTSYLADHLLREQRGEGAMMRRNHLQRYADYVTPDDEFPLIDFRGRFSPASEAIGYGKALMFFHMLRRQLGDEAFLAGLRHFYREHLFRTADWEDLRQSFAAQTESDLRDEFRQWTIRSGAPRLGINHAGSRPAADDSGYLLELTLVQTQAGPDYDLHVPVAIVLDGHDQAHEIDVHLRRAREDFVIELPARPLRVEIDPQFDLFRRVDRLEIPPALSQGFGSDRPLLVIPDAAPESLQARFRALGRTWSGARGGGDITVVSDRELDALPADRDIWLAGWDNCFTSQMGTALSPLPVHLDNDLVAVPGGELRRGHQDAVLVARHPADDERIIAWIATDSPEAVMQYARRLPHFGRYGWLGFDSETMENLMRGQWPVTDSPLAIDIDPDGLKAAGTGRLEYAPRKALTDWLGKDE